MSHFPPLVSFFFFRSVTLKQFSPFFDSEAAITAATATQSNALDPQLASFLKEAFADSKSQLAVIDQTLGGLIKTNLGIPVVYNSSILEMMRGIRQNLETLITSLTETNTNAMRLGLAHGLARFTLAFSPEKVDTMIIHSISLLDELEKEINQYAMRARDCYGLHFPEISKIVTDNVQFSKIVIQMGLRINASGMDFSSFLDEDTERKVKEASEVSMGTEIAEEDIINIQNLCQQVLALSEYRLTLFKYLQDRMNAIAPNLSALVGELVGARLISHAGSLSNLAKQPASTVQILGAEKALFRAKKTKQKRTPKYGLIFNASLIGQANPRIKAKIARALAAKIALSVREDAFGENEGVTIGYKHQLQIEQRIRALDRQSTGFSYKKGKTNNQQQGYALTDQAKNFKSYNDAADFSIPKPSAPAPVAAPEKVEAKEKKEKKEKKDKKEKKSKKDSMED